jgi:hypothetical protein
MLLHNKQERIDEREKKEEINKKEKEILKENKNIDALVKTYNASKNLFNLH